MWDKILSSTLESLQVQMGERAVSGISKGHRSSSMELDLPGEEKMGQFHGRCHI